MPKVSKATVCFPDRAPIGVAVDIRERMAMSRPFVGTKKKKSLADTVMENMASSIDDGSDSDDGDSSDFARAVAV